MSTTTIFIYCFCFMLTFSSITNIISYIREVKDRKEKREKCTEKTTAKIIDVIKTRIAVNSKGHKREVYQYIYEYEVNQEKIIVQADYDHFGRNPSSSEHNEKFFRQMIGNEVVLNYNPKNPREYYIQSEEISYGSIGDVSLIASIGCLVAVLVILIIFAKH